jgi:hypothetical protein
MPKNRKEADELKRITRVVGTDTLLPVARSVYSRRKNRIEAARVQAATTERHVVEPIKERLKRIEEEKARKKADSDRLLKELMDATLAEDELRVARMIQEQADKRKRDEERERKRKITAKEFKANQKERAESLEARRHAKADAEKRAEAQRQGRVKAVIGNIDRLLPDDALKAFSKDKPTDAEKALLCESLKALQRRCAFHIHSLTRVVPSAAQATEPQTQKPR